MTLNRHPERTLLMANDAGRTTHDTLVEHIWQELDRATRERGHAWRTAVLATVDEEGSPQARTVVLRSANQQQSEFRVFTDGRSPKVAELQARPHAVLVFWSALLNWQLRVSVNVKVRHSGAEVDAAWERVRTSVAARDYLSPVAPGQPGWAAGVGGTGPSVGDHHLAVLVAQVRAIDWLELGSHGEHQRCRITTEGVQWLVP